MMKVRQLFVDARGCRGELENPAGLMEAMKKAVISVGATIVGECEARYVPHGVTSVLILAESHFVISTWPEYDLVIADVFFCRPEVDAMNVWKEMVPFCKPGNATYQWVVRTIEPQVELANVV